MNQAFNNWKNGAVGFTFPNGNHVSTTWAECSYSDNYGVSIPQEILSGKNSVKSNTCEIMVSCSDKLEKELEENFNQGFEQPFGYISITDWLEIMRLVANDNYLTEPEEAK